MNQPPEWPLPADGLRPMPSPYRSVVSSASPEFDPPAEPVEVEPEQVEEPQGAPEPDEVPPAVAEVPATVIATAAVPTASLATAPRAASGSAPPPPGSYAPPETRPAPVEVLPAESYPSEVPLSPMPMPGHMAPAPRRALPPGGGPMLPRAISGPPARAVSGPPARIAAPTGSSERVRTLVPETIVTPNPPAPRRLRGMIALVGILFAVLVLGMTGYFWALPVYEGTHATVSAPDNLIGLPKITNSDVYARFSGAGADMQSLGVGTPLVVAYMASDDPAHLVVFVGAPHAVWLSVGRDLDKLIAGLGRNPETAVQSTTPIDPGSLGGVARCGAAKARTQLTVCGWQDHETIALLFFGNRTPDEAAVLMRAMRPALEHGAG